MMQDSQDPFCCSKFQRAREIIFPIIWTVCGYAVGSEGVH